jgi:probable F420-dependent oxidoreductase
VKIDGRSELGLHEVARDARTFEDLGYDSVYMPEVNHDVLLPMALAAQATQRIDIGTGILVAFARSPMTTASAAWDLQTYSGGRFILGIGSQVKSHIERRFSMPWSQPARRMHEYVAAMRAIWHSWETGDDLDFQGEFYSHTLMTPTFSPGPAGAPPPKVFVAAVGERMTQVAAEVADGLILHAFTSARYVEEVTLPILEPALAEAGRERAAFEVRLSPFVISEADGPQRDEAVGRVKGRIAFYGSTPAYRPVLELHGWGELQTDLAALAREGRWPEMGGLIDDDVLDAFAVVSDPDRVVDDVAARFSGVIDRVGLDLPTDADRDWHADVVARLRAI